MGKLAQRSCKPLPAGTPALSAEEIARLLAEIPGWEHAEGTIRRTFQFANFHETMAFVNAVAWIAHREDHHPDMTVGYNRCRVAYNTHSVGGISENDLICADKIEALLGS